MIFFRTERINQYSKVLFIIKDINAMLSKCNISLISFYHTIANLQYSFQFISVTIKACFSNIIALHLIEQHPLRNIDYLITEINKRASSPRLVSILQYY